MNRFYIPPASWNLDALTLEERETHHLRDVLRMAAGEKVVVFDGRGHEATAEIVDIARNSTSLRRLQHGLTPPLPCQITLGQAIPKGKNMDIIVQKATELGASAIIPLISERTVVHIEPFEAESKQAKWHGIAIEAAKQCGQNWVPEIALPLTPKAYFEQGDRFDLMLIASLQDDARSLKSVLADHAQQGHPSPASVLILIGPEGDFTPAESSLSKSHGCRPITLGPIILRTETAAFYCLSVLSHELMGDR